MTTLRSGMKYSHRGLPGKHVPTDRPESSNEITSVSDIEILAYSDVRCPTHSDQNLVGKMPPHSKTACSFLYSTASVVHRI